MPLPKSPTPYHRIMVIGLLIGGVCFLTLTPAMYLAFYALRWTWALHLLERAFLPSLLLAAAAGLLAYQRAKGRQALWESYDSQG